MNLYELQPEIEQIGEALNAYAQEHMGDITDFPYEAQYEALKGERNQKLLNLGAWHKGLSAQSKAYADELKVMQQKKKVIDNKAEWVKRFIDTYLKDGEKINDTRVALSWRKSETVEIDEGKFDIKELKPEWTVITEAIDKAKIKSALKIGKEFTGITLKQNNNLQIK
jgi:hypothetical protein